MKKSPILFLLIGIVFLAIGLPACTTPGSQRALPGSTALMGSSLLPAPALFLPQEEGAEEAKEEPSTLGVALLYIPNRIFDALDMARAGVNIGPGLGIDARATKWCKATFINDMSIGVGYQTLRHLPVCLRSQSNIGVGPISTPSTSLLNWYKGDYDLRVELHVLIVGAHAAVDFGEIVDFIGGIFTWDPMEDDFQIG